MSPWQTFNIDVSVHNRDSGYLARILCHPCEWVNQALRGVHFYTDITWIALCLDGAEKRRIYHPRSATDPAESIFLDVVERCISLLGPPPKARLIPSFQDGIILGFEYESTARTLCYDISRKLRELNRTVENWEWEYHLRASIGPTIDKMLGGLAYARCDHLWFTSTGHNACEGTEISLA